MQWENERRICATRESENETVAHRTKQQAVEAIGELTGPKPLANGFLISLSFMSSALAGACCVLLRLAYWSGVADECWTD
eukprot:scaffold39849_cov52-Attheya_sp.AAC.5